MKPTKETAPPPKGNIYWTRTEVRQFEETLSSLARAIPQDRRRKKGWRRPLVIKAEEQAIPAERRRGWKSLQRLSQSVFKRLALEEPARPVVPSAPPVPPAAGPVMPAPTVEGAVITALGSFEGLMRAVTRAVERWTGDGGLGELLQRLEHAAPAGPSGIAAAPAPLPQRPPGPPTAPLPPAPKPMEKPRNLRVAVVGFLADQFRHLQEKVAELPVDLIAIEKDRARTAFPSCDRILLERHIDHRWSDLARRQLPNSSLAYVHGISEAAQRIADFHSRAIAEAGQRAFVTA